MTATLAPSREATCLHWVHLVSWKFWQVSAPVQHAEKGALLHALEDAAQIAQLGACALQQQSQPKPLCILPCHAQSGLPESAQSAPVQQTEEGAPRHVLGDNAEVAWLGAGPQQKHHIGMLQPLHDGYLRLELLHASLRDQASPSMLPE